VEEEGGCDGVANRLPRLGVVVAVCDLAVGKDLSVSGVYCNCTGEEGGEGVLS
jgi:hypothetical protein